MKKPLYNKLRHSVFDRAMDSTIAYYLKTKGLIQKIGFLFARLYCIALALSHFLVGPNVACTASTAEYFEILDSIWILRFLVPLAIYPRASPHLAIQASGLFIIFGHLVLVPGDSKVRELSQTCGHYLSFICSKLVTPVDDIEM